MDQLSAAVADEDHHVEDFVANRLDDEEVGGPDAVDVAPKESAPGLAAPGRCFRQRYRLIDRLLTTMPSIETPHGYALCPKGGCRARSGAMRSLTAAGRRGRPILPRDFQVQYLRGRGTGLQQHRCLGCQLLRRPGPG